VEVSLGADRNEDTRNRTAFFEAITTVREGLRGMHAAHVGRGSDER
jgi:hypothetical protein